MMLNGINPEDVLFLDVETVPQFANYGDMPAAFQKLWDKKATSLIKNIETDTPQSLYQRAGIYAEFGKIVCISVGFIVPKNGERFFRTMSFAGHDEEELLRDFAEMLMKFQKRKNANLCAHNGKEFDFPYIARRMLVNRIDVPEMLDVAGKKPWEVKFIDTMELWRFGDYKSYTSLNLLTYILGIPSPKDDIDGSQVASTYYNDNDLPRISAYCEKDVLAIAQLLMRYKNQPLIGSDKIERVER